MLITPNGKKSERERKRKGERWVSEEKLVKGREEDGRQMMMKGEGNFEDGEKKEWQEKSFEIGFVSDISSRTFCISLSLSSQHLLSLSSSSLIHPLSSLSLSLALFLVHSMERKDGKSIFIWSKDGKRCQECFASPSLCFSSSAPLFLFLAESLSPSLWSEKWEGMHSSLNPYCPLIFGQGSAPLLKRMNVLKRERERGKMVLLRSQEREMKVCLKGSFKKNFVLLEWRKRRKIVE